jgi:hypothetical protein
MKTRKCVTSAIALAGLVIFAIRSSGQPAATPTVKEIMGKAHKGPNSILSTVGKDLRDIDGPDWDEIKRSARELVSLGSALGKNDPPKGDKASWQKLTKAYTEDAQSLLSAAAKKNKSAAESAHKRLQSSCTSCHKAHRQG